MDPANCIADFLHIKTPKSLWPQLVEAAAFEGGHEGLLIQRSTNVGRPHLFPTQSVGKSLRTKGAAGDGVSSNADRLTSLAATPPKR